MKAKGYHLPRLDAKVEEQILGILHEGSEKVIEILHEHSRDYIEEDNEKYFEKALVQIGKTVSKVASLPEFNYDHTKKRRIAFLPGYTTKKNNRITHKIKYKKWRIPSDISYDIIGKNDVEPVKEAYTNQALLYYYLLENHKDNFRNGGTHQFLLANAMTLKVNGGYNLDLLQVYTGKKKSDHFEELTFLTIQVDFEKMDTVEKLFNHFNKVLNEGSPVERWPLSAEDKKGDFTRNAATYKMRGYLISLWYKLLHDTKKDNIDKWFEDCGGLAQELKFAKLKERLEKLQKEIKRDNGEHYSFWYSLVFEALPDFTVPDKRRIESLGSAMLMTDFELKPYFFCWIQPWVNRMYRHVRDFENIGKAIADTQAKLRNVYTGDEKYLPKKVMGDRLYSVKSGNKHVLELIFYYQELFGKHQDEYLEKIAPVANDILNSINTLHLIQRTLPKSIEKNKKSLAKKTIEIIECSDFATVAPNAIERIESIEEVIIRNLPNPKFGFNSDLLNCENRLTLPRFYFRMVGRLVALTLYTKCNYTINQIQSFLTRKVLIYKNSDSSNDSDFRVCRINFFIEGLVSSDDEHSRRIAISEIQKHLSEFEKEFLEMWYKDFSANTLNEEVLAICKNDRLKEILRNDYKFRF